MAVFEGVFTKRGDAEVPDCPAVGAFDEVFVRRGRWRKGPTSTTQPDYPVSSLSDVTHCKVTPNPFLTDPNESSCVGLSAPPPEGTYPVPHKSTEPAMSEIMDAPELVVKNTFINAAVRCNSLEEFLSERKVQSCPAGSFDIDDILGMYNNILHAEATSKEDGTFNINTASSFGVLAESVPKEATFNTASTFAAIAESVPKEAVFNTGSSSMDAESDHVPQDLTMSEQDLTAEERLRSLRIRGSFIQQKMAEAALHEHEMQAQWLNMAMAEQMLICGSLQQQVQQQQLLQQQLLSNELAANEAPGPHEPASDASMMQDPSMPLSMPPPPLGAAPAAPSVLRLAEAIAPPELGGPQLPSIGSLLHHKGGCKPCTFFHTRGCENKEDCKFCHLCGPGEKKKRLKQLKAAQREATWMALENAKATLASFGSLPEGSDEVDMIIE